MEHKEFESKIKKQQCLIRRLLSSRKNRSRKIQEIVNERYGDLIGKSFNFNGNSVIPGFYDNTDYYIYEISSESDYIMSDNVDIVLKCRCVGEQHSGVIDKLTLSSLYVCNQTHQFKYNNDLHKLLSPYIIPTEKLVSNIWSKCNEFVETIVKID